MRSSMKNNKKMFLPLSFVLALLGYYLLVKSLQPTYVVKAAVKLILFFGLPIAYFYLCGNISLLRQRLLPSPFPWKRLLKLLLPGITMIVLINILADPLVALFGIEQIVNDVVSRTRTSKAILLIAFIYIPFINGLAEEIFFRGFYYLEIAQIYRGSAASIFSAFLFALYHLALINSWFSWQVLLLSMSGLFAIGLILNALVKKNGDILGAWLLHAIANIAILSISFRFYPD